MGETIQLIVFRLGSEEFGLEITQVDQISKAVNITEIPNVPDFIEGIMNYRDEILVVMDLRKRFKLQIKGKEVSNHVLVVDIGLFKVGMIIDSVSEVLHLPTKLIEPVPPDLHSKSITREYLLGIGKVNDGKRLIILVDLMKIFSESELEELDDIYRSDHKIKKIINEKMHGKTERGKTSSKAGSYMSSTRSNERVKQMNIESLKKKIAAEEIDSLKQLALKELLNEMGEFEEEIISPTTENISEDKIKVEPVKNAKVLAKTNLKNENIEKIVPESIVEDKINLEEYQRKLQKWTKKKLVAFLKKKDSKLFNSKMRKKDLIEIILKNIPLEQIK